MRVEEDINKRVEQGLIDAGFTKREWRRAQIESAAWLLLLMPAFLFVVFVILLERFTDRIAFALGLVATKLIRIKWPWQKAYDYLKERQYLAHKLYRKEKRAND